MEIIRREGWWVPKYDEKCLPVVLVQIADLQVALMHFTGRRQVIQAGGNFGIWPCKMAKVFDEVHTFEPDPVVYSCLEKNVHARDMHNILIQNSALGSKQGTCDMVHIDKNNAGSQRVDFKKGKIPVTTIDSLHLKEVDFIQLDIEGAEHDAILGGEKTITEQLPAIMLELKGLGNHFGYPDGYTFDLLSSWGYQGIHRIHRDTIFVHESKMLKERFYG